MTAAKAPGPEETPFSSDDRRVIHQQDGEFVRHNIGLRWSRFQMVSVIEGATLYAAFGGGMSKTESVLLLFLASLLIGLVFAIAIDDRRIAGIYLSRMLEFEKLAGAPLPPGKKRSRFPVPQVAMAAIVAFNVLAIVYLAVGLQGL